MNPYAESFHAYWSAGWRGILPLPFGKKTYPPDGYTGYDGAYPSYADCQTWADDHRPRNVALRLPDGVVGIDVDHYDGKVGGDTLARLVAEHGALPPTWLSTSRDDGISGIRLYRVPAGSLLPTALPGIEFVQRHHRYVVAWPSVHPSGRTYAWIDEADGTRGDGIPNVATIPELPQAWLDGLAVEARQRASKADIDDTEAARILGEMPAGEPCEHILRHAGKAMSGGDRHDSYNAAVLAVVGAGRRGCPGSVQVVQRLRAAFLAEIADRASPGEAVAEWNRSLLGAVAIVADEVQGTVCPDDVLGWLEDITPPADQPAGPDDPPAEPTAYDRAVTRRYAELRIAEDAKAMLAAEKAGQAPPLAGIDLASFLAQPDEDEHYRVDGLWPAEGRVLLPAPAKAGKTTLVVGNLIPALVDGGDFLGRFRVDPVRRRVVLLNLEVGERTLRGWARRAGITGSDRVTVVNLRGRVGALGLGSAAGRARLAAFLRDQDAEVVVLDPLAPALASLGLDENVNADVALFFSWWSEALGEAGVVDDLICHHIGHGGERSRGASRLLDEPDAIWTLTRDGGEEDDGPFGGVERRYLKAYGRDVDLPESGLRFDGSTGRLHLLDGGRRKLRQQDTAAEAEQRVLAYARGNAPLPKGRLAAAAPGNKDNNAAAIDRLVGAGLLFPVPSGTGHRYYTEPERPRASPSVPDIPGDAGVGASLRPRPYSGDASGDGRDGENGDDDGSSVPLDESQNWGRW